jgi:hypothetical protein
LQVNVDTSLLRRVNVKESIVVEEERPAVDTDGEEQPQDEGSERLTQSVRRERLEKLADQIGENAVMDGERVVVEAGEPVVLHLELDREGIYSAIWWATALTENAHHRWRDAAEPLLQDGESVHTSALGGGYLVELERSTRDEAELLGWAQDAAPVDRIRELLQRFPEEVGKLPPEPVPDYLLPPEPELPPLGEVEADSDEERSDGDSSG